MTTSRLESSLKTVQQDATLENVEQVLSDAYDLLELYSPSWYSELLRERIRSALSWGSTSELA
jgi:hypothetical protein